MASRYQITFHPLAEKEYLESVSWYEENRTGLGLQYIQTLEKTLNTIETNPYLYQVKKQVYREAMLKIFPYIIVYKIYPKQKRVNVLSIFHTSRNPSHKYRR